MNRHVKEFIYSFVEFFNSYAWKIMLAVSSLAGVIALILVVSSC